MHFQKSTIKVSQIGDIFTFSLLSDKKINSLISLQKYLKGLRLEFLISSPRIPPCIHFQHLPQNQLQPEMKPQAI